MNLQIPNPESPASPAPADGDLVSLVYFASQEDQPWRSLVDYLYRRMRLRYCSISFHRGAQYCDQGTVYVQSGDLDYAKLAEGYWPRFQALDPVPYTQLAPGRVHVFSKQDYLAYGARGAEFFEGFMEVNGFEHLLLVNPRSAGGAFQEILTCVRGREAGPYTAAEIGSLQAVIPHLDLAMRQFFARNQLQLERDLYEQTIDSLGVGSLLVDRDCRILSANHYADELLTGLEPLGVTDGRLVIREPRKGAEFRRLIQMLASNPSDGKIRVMRLQGRDGEEIGLLLKPILPTAAYFNTEQSKVQIFLHNPPARHDAPAGLVAELFGLTPAQAMLAIRLARGETISEAAAAMNISENTARNYSKRIFAATGVNRQADLVRIMLQSVALLTK